MSKADVRKAPPPPRSLRLPVNTRTPAPARARVLGQIAPINNPRDLCGAVSWYARAPFLKSRIKAERREQYGEMSVR